MAEEVIYPENLSKDLLKSLLLDAYMDVTVDNDGDILVKDTPPIVASFFRIRKAGGFAW